jgi:hypothetical protein
MPNLNGSRSDGWFKAYFYGSTNETWSTQTSANDAHQIFLAFDAVNVYTMEISGRSKDYLSESITLSNNATDPPDLDNLETPCTNVILDITDSQAQLR